MVQAMFSPHRPPLLGLSVLSTSMKENGNYFGNRRDLAFSRTMFSRSFSAIALQSLPSLVPSLVPLCLPSGCPLWFPLWCPSGCLVLQQYLVPKSSLLNRGIVSPFSPWSFLRGSALPFCGSYSREYIWPPICSCLSLPFVLHTLFIQPISEASNFKSDSTTLAVHQHTHSHTHSTSRSFTACKFLTASFPFFQISRESAERPKLQYLSNTHYSRTPSRWRRPSVSPAPLILQVSATAASFKAPNSSSDTTPCSHLSIVLPGIRHSPPT